MLLLDTNILSEIVRREPHPAVLRRYRETPDTALFTSAICVEEMRYGCCAGPDTETRWRKVRNRVLSRVTVLAFDHAVALVAGELRAEWKLQGTPVGYADGLIGATALAFEMTLVTRNVRHFDHIARLRIEDWFA
jgi:predicted nucleic acid-binding protein